MGGKNKNGCFGFWLGRSGDCSVERVLLMVVGGLVLVDVLDTSVEEL
jgi:hypothetical protein